MVEARSARGGRTASTSRFTYQPRSSAAATERLKHYQSGNRDSFTKPNIDTFSPKEGDNWVRILPPTWEGAEHYAMDLYVHYEVGPDNGTYLCLEQMKGEMCPLCEERKRADKAGEEDYARALTAGLRLAAWVIDRDDEKKGPLLWLYAPTIDREILEQSRDKRTGEVLMIDHPDDGFDVEFVRTGKGLKTKYTGVKLARQASSVNDAAIKFVEANPIDSVLIFHDAAHIAAAFGAEPPAEPARAAEPEARATPPAREPAPARTPAAAAKPAEKAAAATPATSNRTRRQAPPANTGPDFKSMDINQLLDYADSKSIVVPDTVPDEGVAEFLENYVP